MKRRLLVWLACPTCRSELALDSATSEAEDVEEGQLVCTKCSRRYAIRKGIPRLLPLSLTAEATATAERFGYEWTRFSEIRDEYETQFLGWIAPLGRAIFADRVVLDAGCGKGRHLRLAATFGAREVIGLELGPAVETAAVNTHDLDCVHLVQGDLTRPPLRPGVFDIIFSVGVLHHLAEPVAGFHALAPLLARKGCLASWVYAREGNAWLLALLHPLRRLTCALTLPVVRALACMLAAPLWVALRVFYGPGRRWRFLGRLLPYRSYLEDLVPFQFREIHSIVFDQLLAPVAHYMSRADVERCFVEAGLALHSLRWHHRNSWAAWGTQKT